MQQLSAMGQEPPASQKKPICFSWQNKGICFKGSECHYDHPHMTESERNALQGRQGQGFKSNECFQWKSVNGCKFGTRCKFEHVGNGRFSDQANRHEGSRSNVGRNQECRDFARGSCTRGDGCRFNHGGARPDRTKGRNGSHDTDGPLRSQIKRERDDHDRTHREDRRKVHDVLDRCEDEKRKRRRVEEQLHALEKRTRQQGNEERGGDKKAH